MHRAEGNGLGVALQLRKLVAEDNLVVVVAAGHVVVDTAGRVKEGRRSGIGGLGGSASGRGAQRDAVDAGAAIPVLQLRRRRLPGGRDRSLTGSGTDARVQRENPLRRHLGRIVGHRLLDADSPEDGIILRDHPDPVHLCHIDDGDIEIGRLPHRHAELLRDALADLVVLAFQRSVDAAVRRVESHRAQVALDAVDRAKDVPLQVGADEAGREGIVHLPLLAVDRNPLHVGGHAAADVQHRRQIGGNGTGRLRTGKQTEQQARCRDQIFLHRLNISS